MINLIKYPACNQQLMIFIFIQEKHGHLTSIQKRTERLCTQRKAQVPMLLNISFIIDVPQ
jgi:hypothetical protein